MSTFASGYQTLTRRSTARLAPRKRLRKRLKDPYKKEHDKAGTKEEVEEEVERKRLKDPDKEEHGKAGSEEEVESDCAGAPRRCPASVDLFYVCAGILDACAEFFGVGPSLLGPILDISKYSTNVAQAESERFD